MVSRGENRHCLIWIALDVAGGMFADLKYFFLKVFIAANSQGIARGAGIGEGIIGGHRLNIVGLQCLPASWDGMLIAAPVDQAVGQVDNVSAAAVGLEHGQSNYIRTPGIIPEQAGIGIGEGSHYSLVGISHPHQVAAALS